MKKAYLLLIAFTLVFTACKKGVDDFPNTPNTGEIPGSAVKAAYLPLNAGTEWVYHAESGVGDLTVKDTRTITLNGKTKAINGQLFYEGTSKSNAGTNTGYLGYNNGIYAQQLELAEAGLNTIIPLYNDKKKVGEPYIQPFSYTSEGQIITARFNAVLVDENITLTIGSKTYNNVMHSKVMFEVMFEKDWITYNEYEFYVAKDVGLIKTKTSVFGMQIDKIELISYKIGK